MEKEICIYDNEENRQVILDEETFESVEDVEWVNLIGARIIRIREEEDPEYHLVFTLLLRD